MKIYLVSLIYCWSDESMEKHFWSFSDKEQALRFKNKLVESLVCDMCDHYDLEENSLELLEEQYITVTHNSPMIFSMLAFDGTEEIEIEVTKLEVQ